MGALGLTTPESSPIAREELLGSGFPNTQCPQEPDEFWPPPCASLTAQPPPRPRFLRADSTVLTRTVYIHSVTNTPHLKVPVLVERLLCTLTS